jgi:predicted AlkP superfamily phosphohydrolase/phosphomutase
MFILVLCALSGSAQARGRVVILGFDGVDAGIVQKELDAGHLPNLAALRTRGGFAPLTPPVPAQTPVSWASFSTGLDPGSTRIFDFLKRDPKTLRPTFALADESEVNFLFGPANPWVFAAAVLFLVGLLPLAFLRGSLVRALVFLVGAGLAGSAFLIVSKDIPSRRPSATNNRQGETLWGALGKAGKKAVVVRMPVTFPPDEFPRGRLLSGLGVPDLSGRIGRPSFFTSDPFFAPKSGNDFSIELGRLDSNVGAIKAKILGPPGKPFGRGQWLETSMALTVDGDRKGLTVEVSGSRFHLTTGEWSDWVRLSFRANPLISVHGMGRFRLDSVSPEISLYLSPVNFDPRALPPGFHISFPGSWAEDLVHSAGLYKTMGWAIDTWSIQSGVMSEKAFLEDIEATTLAERRILDTVLADSSVDCAVQYFEFPDRVSHVFWRLRDPKHPAYDAALAARYGDAVEKSYAKMDEIVGQTAHRLGPDDVLVVVSDHGFATWRRSVNYDTWLVENGYMKLKGESRRKNLDELFSHGTFWDAVDWSGTKAYAMGLGEIYLNVAGREKDGIVSPGAQYESVRAEIARRLLDLHDPKDGASAVSRVVPREKAYRHFDPNLIPDLFVLNSPGFRVSWQSSLGAPTEQVFEDNREVWSGDHCSVDPLLVKGVLFASKPIRSEAPTIMDVEPSILQLFGISPGVVDGKPVF